LQIAATFRGRNRLHASDRASSNRRRVAVSDAHGTALALSKVTPEGSFRRRTMLARLDNLLRSSLLLAVLACAVVASEPALAGCGCTKPPPPLASVRPSVAWSGAEVTLFDAALVAGQSYEIRFDSGTANGPPRRVTGTAVSKRDLSDGVYKPQVVVPLPAIPLGPASVQIRTVGGAVIADLADDVFTVAPSPIGIPTGVGVYRFENYRAAVGRDGTVYLALDFGDVQHARVFDAQAVGLPLRFESRDLAFWNVQGFLMQLLGQNMPGLFAIDAGVRGLPEARFTG